MIILEIRNIKFTLTKKAKRSLRVSRQNNHNYEFLDAQII